MSRGEQGRRGRHLQACLLQLGRRAQLLAVGASPPIALVRVQICLLHPAPHPPPCETQTQPSRLLHAPMYVPSWHDTLSTFTAQDRRTSARASEKARASDAKGPGPDQHPQVPAANRSCQHYQNSHDGPWSYQYECHSWAFLTCLAHPQKQPDENNEKVPIGVEVCELQRHLMREMRPRTRLTRRV